MKKKLMLIVVAALAFFTVVGSGSASAKAKVYKSKVYAVKQISHHYFKKSRIGYAQGGLIYTSRSLKHWNHRGLNLRKTAWTSNQSVTVKKSNGKKAVYYYIKNKKTGIKGWIWRNYLGPTPVVDSYGGTGLHFTSAFVNGKKYMVEVTDDSGEFVDEVLDANFNPIPVHEAEVVGYGLP